jgi:hypothetical protein
LIGLLFGRRIIKKEIEKKNETKNQVIINLVRINKKRKKHKVRNVGIKFKHVIMMKSKRKKLQNVFLFFGLIKITEGSTLKVLLLNTLILEP